jgi:hypothetical protein
MRTPSEPASNSSPRTMYLPHLDMRSRLHSIPCRVLLIRIFLLLHAATNRMQKNQKIRFTVSSQALIMVLSLSLSRFGTKSYLTISLSHSLVLCACAYVCCVYVFALTLTQQRPAWRSPSTRCVRIKPLDSLEVDRKYLLCEQLLTCNYHTRCGCSGTSLDGDYGTLDWRDIRSSCPRGLSTIRTRVRCRTLCQYRCQVMLSLGPFTNKKKIKASLSLRTYCNRP